MNSKPSFASSPEIQWLFHWAFLLAIFTLLCSGLRADIWVIPASVFLPLHTLAELFSVLVGAMVFSLIWEQRRIPLRSELLLGSAFLAAALLDIGHLFSYSGMPDFVTPSGPEKAIWFWLFARLVAALALLAYALNWPSAACATRGCRRYGLGLALGTAALVYWLILSYGHWLPATYQPGTGLTGFKVGAEYLIMLLNGAATWFLYRRWQREGVQSLALMALATWVMLCSEWFFSRYLLTSDLANLLGHAYKVVAYFLIYRGLVRTLVHEPYALAEQAAFQNRVLIDSSPDGIFVVDAQGKLVEVNETFARQLGYRLDEMAGLG